MRTTVTLEEDVEQLIRDTMGRTRQSFKVTLNQAIRRGLSAGTVPGLEGPFQIEARPMGLRAGIDPARLNQLGDELEIDAFLEAARRLRRSDLGKS